jgi:hypothetical protein
MTTQTQPWLRAELIAAPETTPGAQLMIPADGIEFHDDQLVFHHQGDVVYVAPQGQLRSITWFARQPHPETARRKAQWPNHGTRWTDEERTELHRHLRAGHSWKVISHAHGRSRTGCQQEAVKQGWLDAETLRLKPEFLPEPGPADPERTAAAPEAQNPASPPAAADDARETQAAPAPAPDPTAGYPAASPAADRGTAPAGARHRGPKASAEPSSTGQAPPRPSDYTAPGSAPPSITETSATPQRPSAPHSANHAPPPSSDTPGTASLSANAPFGPATPHTAAPYVLSRQPAGAPAPNVFSSALTSDAASPDPDRPRFPARVPRQRTNPDNLPSPEKGPDPEPGPEAGPRPGSRFLSRAQSSLARATLGAYMNPPRGDSGLAPEAT